MAIEQGTFADQQALIAEAVAERVWAIVGASTDPTKYGNIIYKTMKASGYRVYAVNPRARQVEGDPCYPSVASLPEQPGVVNMVVPPKIGLAIADEVAAARIERIWFQPGAESPATIAHAQALGLKTIAHACAMVASRGAAVGSQVSVNSIF